MGFGDFNELDFQCLTSQRRGAYVQAQDSFNGAYLARRLNGDDALTAASAAGQTAARVIQHPEAIVPIPPDQERMGRVVESVLTDLAGPPGQLPPTSRYVSGAVRRNSGWDELIRPVAELFWYPADIRMPIISARVRSRPVASATITRYRSGSTTPAGGCQRSVGPRVHPTAVNAATRSLCDKGCGTGNAGYG